MAKRLASNGGTTAPPSAQGHGVSTQRGGHTYVPTAAQKQAAASRPSSALAQAAAGISGTDWSGIASQAGAAAAAAGARAAAGSYSQASMAPSEAQSLFKTPTWTPSNPGEADPRDSTYWANLAKLQFQDYNEYNKSLAEESTEGSNYNLALQQAIRGRGIQERELGESAIKSNLSASGWLNRTQAEQSTDYAEERGAASRQHEANQQAFLAARKALQQGFGIEAAELLAEAAGRRAELAAEQTETGLPEVAAPSGGNGNANAHPVGAKRWAKIIREGQKKGKK